MILRKVAQSLNQMPTLKRKWWKLLLLGFLIAIAISLWPSAWCALAQTCDGPKDVWCDPNGTQCCGPTNGLGVLVGCSRGAYGYCIQDFIADSWGVRCTNEDDCNVTECVTSPKGYGCYLKGDGRWDVGRCSAYPTCSRQSRTIPVTCCTGDSIKPTPCPKTGPAIANSSLATTPPFPLVLGQDPEKLGVTITNVTAEAGVHDCKQGTITDLTISVSLSKDSVSWIKGELARKYPGAKVLGTYPFTPDLTITGLNSSTARASFHFDPLDPGDYEVTVTAVQDDGQTVVRVFKVHVALYESTITQ